MIKTLNNNIGLWPQSADDDDTCLNVNIGLWPQDVLTSLAQESPGWPAPGARHRGTAKVPIGQGFSRRAGQGENTICKASPGDLPQGPKTLNQNPRSFLFWQQFTLRIDRWIHMAAQLPKWVNKWRRSFHGG